MSRALTGSTVVVTRSGRFKASVPVALGSGKRKQLTFDTKVEAEQWVRASLAAITAGGSPLPAPAPRGGRTAVAPSATGPTFTQVAEAWLAEHYVKLRRGEVSREDQVRRYTEVIAAHMREEGLTIETLTHDSTLMNREPPLTSIRLARTSGRGVEFIAFAGI